LLFGVFDFFYKLYIGVIKTAYYRSEKKTAHDVFDEEHVSTGNKITYIVSSVTGVKNCILQV
jgi:hypothetical protein